MRQSYSEQDYAEAMRYADILLRTRPQLSQHVFPMLGRMAENTDARDELKRALAANPPWRAQFFDCFPSQVTDARTPLEFLLRLSNTPTPSTEAERSSVSQALVAT